MQRVRKSGENGFLRSSTDASPQAPFLSLSVKLDRRIITQLITEVPSIVTAQEGEVTPIVVDEAGKDLLQVFSRFVELLDTPSRIPVLAPMILREKEYCKNINYYQIIILISAFFTPKNNP